MRLRLLALAPTLAACSGDPWDVPGLARPGTLRLVLATDDGVDVTAASAVLDELRVERCDAEDDQTIVRSLVSLETTAAYLVDGGWWCGVDAIFEPPLVVTADGPDDSSLAAELEVARVRVPVRPAMYVDGHPLLLELGADGWLSAAGLSFEPGAELAVLPGGAGHEALAGALEDRSALWLDAGADGLLGDDEAESGPLATGPKRER